MNYLAQLQTISVWNNILHSNSQKEKEDGTNGKKQAEVEQRHDPVEYKTRVGNLVLKRKTSLNPMMPIFYSEEPLHLKNAKECYLYENNGKKNLDCINNVSHIGHCHPEFVSRMQKQMERLLTNSRFLYDELNHAVEKLLTKLPPQLSVVTFVNSGSEANDLAMQMAELHTGKSGIICVDNAYHGITRACMQVSPYKWKDGYRKPDHVTIARTPDTYRGLLRDSENPAEDYSKHIGNLIDQNTGAFICEFMQSCGGQIIPPKNLYQQTYKVLKERGVVCIEDQVQTGFGRIGSNFWAFQYYGVIPDILTIGKPMGNGFPVSAVICTPEIAQSFRKQGEFFSTYGGNPLAATAATIVLEIIEKEKLQENAFTTGELLKTEMIKLIEKYNFVGDVRGLGLFLGIDIVKCKQSREEDGELAKKIIDKMRGKGVLISRDGPKGNVLKFKPPIVFKKEHAKQLLEKLISVLDQVNNDRNASQ